MSSSPLRVFHLMEAMKRGGAESVVAEHARHAGQGVEVIVCAINGGGPALEAAKAHGAHTIDMSHQAPSGMVGRLARLKRLVEIVRSAKPHVVNAHNPTGALYGVPAARMAGVPVIVRTEHSIHDTRRHSGLYLKVEPRLTSWSSRIICVCEAVRHSHAPRLPKWSDRFVSIANGVSEVAVRRARGEVRAALGLSEEHRIVLTAGSLTPQKAQHVMLEAFARLMRRAPAARLVVAGGGPLQEQLTRQSGELGIGDQVLFLGPRDDVSDLMGAADVYVLSSVREGLSITLLEAMQAGLPLVATDVGGNGEAICDGETGRLFPANDASALATALEELVLDAGRAAGMGQAGHQRWSEHFRAERMVRETETLYRTVLSDEGRSSSL